MNNENFTRTQKFIYGAGSLLFGLVILAVLNIFGVRNSLVTFLLFVVPFFVGYNFPKIGLQLSKLVVGWGIASARRSDGSLAVDTAKKLADGSFEKSVSKEKSI